MKYICTILFVICATAAFAQQPQAAPGRVELNDGKLVIESFRAKTVDGTTRLETGDLKILPANGTAAEKFAVPVVFSVPASEYSSRRRVDPGEYAGQLKVTVVELSQRDGELYLDLEIRLSGDVMNRRLSYLLIPELVAGDNTVTGAGILVNGWGKDQLFRRRMKYDNTRQLENMPDVKIAATKYSDDLIRYTLRMPYQGWMDSAVLDIHQVLGSPAGKEQLYTLANAGRVKPLQTREFYAAQPEVTFIMPAAGRQSRRSQDSVHVDFQVARSVIVRDFRNNSQELARIDRDVRAVQNSKVKTMVSMSVEGYASPEGSYAYNERLARARSQSLADYISQQYDIPAERIRTGFVAEDWDNLRRMVVKSNIDRRDEILEIIDTEPNPDRREQRLKALGASWTTMLETMFPELRRVEYQIDAVAGELTVEELRNLSALDREKLSQRELFQLAQSYEYGSPQWEQPFETAIRLYPDDPTAILNYSSVLLMRGDLAAAKHYLDRVADKPYAHNNMGVYYLLSGQRDTAHLHLHEAKAAGSPQADYNLRLLASGVEYDPYVERYGR